MQSLRVVTHSLFQQRIGLSTWKRRKDETVVAEVGMQPTLREMSHTLAIGTSSE